MKRDVCLRVWADAKARRSAEVSVRAGSHSHNERNLLTAGDVAGLLRVMRNN
jgi:hypothetical protein